VRYHSRTGQFFERISSAAVIVSSYLVPKLHLGTSDVFQSCALTLFQHDAKRAQVQLGHEIKDGAQCAPYLPTTGNWEL
jgi:hypothetical protein